VRAGRADVKRRFFGAFCHFVAIKDYFGNAGVWSLLLFFKAD
jgi:hypothetical protein